MAKKIRPQEPCVFCDTQKRADELEAAIRDISREVDPRQRRPLIAASKADAVAVIDRVFTILYEADLLLDGTEEESDA